MEYFIKFHGHGAGTIITSLETVPLSYKIVKCPFPRHQNKKLVPNLSYINSKSRWGLLGPEGHLDRSCWASQTINNGSLWTYNGHVVFVQHQIKTTCAELTKEGENLREPNYSFQMGYVKEPGCGFWLGTTEFLQNCKRYYPYGVWINDEGDVATAKKPLNLAAEKIPGKVNGKLVEDINNFPTQWKSVDIQPLDCWVSLKSGKEYYISALSSDGLFVDMDVIESTTSLVHIHSASVELLLTDFKKIS